MTAVEAVEAEVRELVRRRGLDLVRDRTVMRRLVEEVVSDYDERSLTSSLPPLPDARTAARSVYDAVAGLGPLQRHRDDPEIEEIWISERLPGGWIRCSWRIGPPPGPLARVGTTSVAARCRPGGQHDERTAVVSADPV